MRRLPAFVQDRQLHADFLGAPDFGRVRRLDVQRLDLRLEEKQHPAVVRLVLERHLDALPVCRPAERHFSAAGELVHRPDLSVRVGKRRGTFKREALFHRHAPLANVVAKRPVVVQDEQVVHAVPVPGEREELGAGGVRPRRVLPGQGFAQGLRVRDRFLLRGPREVLRLRVHPDFRHFLDFLGRVQRRARHFVQRDQNVRFERLAEQLVADQDPTFGLELFDLLNDRSGEVVALRRVQDLGVSETVPHDGFLVNDPRIKACALEERQVRRVPAPRSVAGENAAREAFQHGDRRLLTRQAFERRAERRDHFGQHFFHHFRRFGIRVRVAFLRAGLHDARVAVEHDPLHRLGDHRPDRRLERIRRDGREVRVRFLQHPLRSREDFDLLGRKLGAVADDLRHDHDVLRKARHFTAFGHREKFLDRAGHRQRLGVGVDPLAQNVHVAAGAPF